MAPNHKGVGDEHPTSSTKVLVINHLLYVLSFDPAARLISLSRGVNSGPWVWFVLTLGYVKEK